MKRIIIIIPLFLFAFFCFGQKNQHLEPADMLNQDDGTLKEYYEKRFNMLYKGFSKEPFARYVSMPSFQDKYAFSVETIGGKTYIISNSLSHSLSLKKTNVKPKTNKTKIENKLYIKIGELFQLLAEQTKTIEIYTYTKDGTLIRIDSRKLDGTTFLFYTTDKNGYIKIGTTWSPGSDTLLGKLIKICDNLYFIGNGKNISQMDVAADIDILINDMKLFNR